MRLLLFFDLPTVTNTERSIAARFRRDIIKEGFLMLQESVYCKLLLNETVFLGLRKRLEKIKPKAGNIMLLKITEKQFNSIEMLIGERQNKVINSTERLTIL
ncbi:MAG: CRISPR-associated endonuclease Cas2 [Christensenellales bacterium]|jgi:CRISPR-associated protein Cas2